MAIKDGTTLDDEALSFLVGLIKNIVNVSDSIDDSNIRTDGVYSSVHVKELIDKCLQDANTHSESICNALVKLTAKKTTIQPTLENSEKNIIYLYSENGNAPFEQYLKISDTELIDMGSTSISLDNYITITQVAQEYVKLTDFNGLKTEVEKIKTSLGTDDISTLGTTVKEAINKLNSNIKTELGSDTLNTKSQTVKGGINELKEEIENKAITLDDEVSETSENGIKNKVIKQYVDDSIQANAIGKQTVLFEGNITATGTYNLTDNVNNYDIVIINHNNGASNNYKQSTMLSKTEIKKCTDTNNLFACMYGDGSYSIFTTGYFNNNKLIIIGYNNENITSITGIKLGQITVQNTITNPSQAISYSTDEQLTGGTWIDGKPIYRKVIPINEQITFTPTTTNGTIATDSKTYKNKFDKSSIIIHNSFGQIQWRGTDNTEASSIMQIPWVSHDQNFSIDMVFMDSRSSTKYDYDFQIRYGTTRTVANYAEILYVVIEYTKTTD